MQLEVAYGRKSENQVHGSEHPAGYESKHGVKNYCNQALVHEHVEYRLII